MWGPSYWGTTYGGPAYWGPGTTISPPAPGGPSSGYWSPAYDGPDAWAGSYFGTSTATSPSLSFRETLVAKLASIPELTALVGTAIYPGAIPETHDLGSDGPVLTYRISSYPHGKVLAGSDGTASPRVQFDAWSADFALADAITKAIRDAIFRRPVNPWTPGGVEIMSVSKDDEFDIAEPPKAATDQWTYRVMSTYQIKHRVPIPSSA
jgi:hypothetical protein